MKYLISTLAKKNDFKMDYMKPCVERETCITNPDDGVGGRKMILDHVEDARAKNKDGKYLVMKHQYWLNFTEYNLPKPTYINVVRDPVARFASKYYFQRFGFEGMGNADKESQRKRPK